MSDAPSPDPAVRRVTSRVQAALQPKADAVGAVGGWRPAVAGRRWADVWGGVALVLVIVGGLFWLGFAADHGTSEAPMVATPTSAFKLGAPSVFKAADPVSADPPPAALTVPSPSVPTARSPELAPRPRPSSGRPPAGSESGMQLVDAGTAGGGPSPASPAQAAGDAPRIAGAGGAAVTAGSTTSSVTGSGGAPAGSTPSAEVPTALPSWWPAVAAALGLSAAVALVELAARRHRRRRAEATVTLPPAGAAATVTHAPPPADTAPGRTTTHTPGGEMGDPGLNLVLTRYRLVRHLGEGAYGTVFLGVPADRPTERVALKFFAYRTARWADLQAEVKRLADLDGVHGIVRLHEVVADADPPYFVMQYAEGGSLAGRLKAGTLPPDEVSRLAGQLAAALAAVHARGIVHCDLKPANILLDAGGSPLLADFGQAQLVGEDAPALGTLFYMPPDQADLDRRTPDPRWDVYALGAVLHALACGQPPHAADTVRAALDRTKSIPGRLKAYREQLLAAPPPTGHHGKCGTLAGVIDRCLARDPAERYPDAAAVAAALTPPTPASAR